MDDIKRPRGTQQNSQQHRAKISLPRSDYRYAHLAQEAVTPARRRKLRLPKLQFASRLHRPSWLPKFPARYNPFRVLLRFSIIRRFVLFNRRHRWLIRVGYASLAGLVLFSMFYEIFGWRYKDLSYQLSPQAQSLLTTQIPQYAAMVKYDEKNGVYTYNKGYTPTGSGVSGQISGPKFSAEFNIDPTKGVTVNDSVYNSSVTLKPKFALDQPRKQNDRLVYPLFGMKAANVYTFKATNIKEDIVFEKAPGNTIAFDYEVATPDGLEPRMENDGSLGIYGPEETAILGNVTTSNDKDAQLLKKAREKAPKTHRVFHIPAPFIKEANGRRSSARTWFSLDGRVLTVHATNLIGASYPLTIDPSVYIETAAKLMRGNNESNIDFDVDNQLIQKGKTTGARFNSWLNALALNENRWNAGTAAAGGYIYSVGGGKADAARYTVPGTSTFVVPTGVTSITVKAWGGGGGGGGSSTDKAGGDGGGGGYATSVLTVTPGETLNIAVGGGGTGGRYTAPDVMGDGGGGGGYSGVLRSTTPLLIAAGGGGGGGANGDSASASRAAGSAGGAGGNTTSGVAGSGNGSTTGGGAGTNSTGGSAGSSSSSGGSAGSSLTGGQGASFANAFRTTGGSNGGGNGGNGATDTSLSSNKRPGGGGGGGGYYGGGGGGRGNADYNGGAGGGGGSSYTSGSSQSATAGSGTTPGNSADTDRNGAGSGGAGGSATSGPNSGTTGSDGMVLITISSFNTSATTGVYWAHFNTTSYAVEATNPGGGTCTNWCTNSAYDLPAARAGFSLVAYNGFLYAIGGVNGSGTRQSTVYIAKLGANGEPQLWHPTDTNKNNWVYWYSSSSTLSVERSYSAAVAYNNRLYLLGGQTNAATGGVTTVEYTNIAPTGDIGSWTSTGMVALPSARHNHSVQIYNDYLYLIGGNSSGTLQNSVSYIKIASDGTMSGSWNTANSFSTARMAWGGNLSVIWGAYIYVAGGCSAINGSGYCTTVQSDIQLTSINADGSLADWNTIIGVTNDRIGYGFVAWRNGLYQIGGCKQQNASTGACTWGVAATNYGSINQDGDASTVSNSVASGTAPCSGGTPYDCNIPTAGTGNSQGGNMSGGAVINNGIIYYIGGCYSVGNGSVCFTGNSGKASDNTFYASIASDGTIQPVSSCTGTGMNFVGSWCTDNSHNLPSGLAGFGVTVFNNVIYVIGGTDGTTWQSNVYTNALNSDGSLNNWSTQSFSSIALGSARGYMYSFTRANPSSASTYPGNLYVIGGCAPNPVGTTGLDCSSTQYSDVYKCNINTSGAIESSVGNQCSTTSQLQLDSEPGTAGTQGLGVMSGAVYANYIYLVGGQSPNESARGEVMYAKIDNSNNIVAVSGGIWQTSGNQLSPARRRGVAFGYNGYLYALTGYNSGETLNDLLFAKINVSDGSIGAFTQSTVTVLPRWDSSAIVNNGYVYTLGGCSTGVPPQNCTNMNSVVQTFQLYNNYSGAPAAFSAGANLFGTDRIGAGATIYNGYIYIAGGCSGTTDCTSLLTSVQKAAIDASGAIGTWSATTQGLPAARSWGKLVQAGGTLYWLGGRDNLNFRYQTVYYSTPNGSGDTTTWSTASNGIPSTQRERFGAAVWNNRIYVVGGVWSGGRLSSVGVSPQLNSGGDITSAWTSTTAFNVAREGAAVAAYANNLYLFGGYDGTNYLMDSQYAKINSDGTLGSWSYSTTLPAKIRDGEAFAANGFMYVMGGRSADTTCSPHIYVSPISANTTIASGNNPTGVGQWFETNQKYSGSRYGANAVYSNGKAYILGGACGATLTYTGANRVVQTTLLAQPQIARYSRMIDTDTDVYPTKWLMNGLDNSTGAQWTMKYSSMTNTTTSCTSPAMTTWGQETNYGTITLGTPATYTPKNGSGTNTNCARFFYMSVSIDSSQAFGYPEDVTRGPTIADLTLFFTADPSKRMRHGKTFTGGELQPLDTPF